MADDLSASDHVQDYQDSTGYILGVSLGGFLLSFILSWFIGYLFGMVSAFIIIKNRDSLRGSVAAPPTYFVIVVVCVAYISFYLGGILQFSGITSCFFAGMTFRKFHEIACADIFEQAEIGAVENVFGFLSSIFDSLVFFSIGMSFLTENVEGELHLNITTLDSRFFAWGLLLTIVGRAIFVYPLCSLVNYFNRSLHRSESNPSAILNIEHCQLSSTNKTHASPSIISLQYQHYIFLSGLRGPVSYAAATLFPASPSGDHSGTVLTTTKMIVVITIIINGGIMGPILTYFHKKDQAKGDVPETFSHEDPSDSPSLANDDHAGDADRSVDKVAIMGGQEKKKRVASKDFEVAAKETTDDENDLDLAAGDLLHHGIGVHHDAMAAMDSAQIDTHLGKDNAKAESFDEASKSLDTNNTNDAFPPEGDCGGITDISRTCSYTNTISNSSSYRNDILIRGDCNYPGSVDASTESTTVPSPRTSLSVLRGFSGIWQQFRRIDDTYIVPVFKHYVKNN